MKNIVFPVTKMNFSSSRINILPPDKRGVFSIESDTDQFVYVYW